MVKGTKITILPPRGFSFTKQSFHFRFIIGSSSIKFSVVLVNLSYCSWGFSFYKRITRISTGIYKWVLTRASEKTRSSNNMIWNPSVVFSQYKKSWLSEGSIIKISWWERTTAQTMQTGFERKKHCANVRRHFNHRCQNAAEMDHQWKEQL